MNIYEKLVAIQSELKAPKGQYNSFGKYKYRSCEDILEAVKPILKKYKCTLTLRDEVEAIGDRIYVKAIANIVDVEGDDTSWVTTTAFAREPNEKKGMDESQITGTASSYARKYALNGLFCIDDTKDADTDEYQEQTKKVTKPKTVTKTVEILCEGCKRPVEAGGNMTAEQVAEASKTKYGKIYCSACRAKKRQAEEAKKQILEAKGQTEEEVNLPFPLD